MSQRAIREYDAKRLFAQVSGRTYTGFLLTHEAEIDPLTQQLEDAAFSSWVVKPDQLFGKRGKYGLVGVDLAPAEVVKWIKHHRHEQVTIGDRQGLLDTFLVEPFVPHQEEYYIAFETKRTTDRILFSSQGGMEIEEQRESITSVDISVLEDLQEHHLDEITQDLSSSV